MRRVCHNTGASTKCTHQAHSLTAPVAPVVPPSRARLHQSLHALPMLRQETKGLRGLAQRAASTHLSVGSRLALQSRSRALTCRALEEATALVNGQQVKNAKLRVHYLSKPGRSHPVKMTPIVGLRVWGDVARPNHWQSAWPVREPDHQQTLATEGSSHGTPEDLDTDIENDDDCYWDVWLKGPAPEVSLQVYKGHFISAGVEGIRPDDYPGELWLVEGQKDTAFPAKPVLEQPPVGNLSTQNAHWGRMWESETAIIWPGAPVEIDGQDYTHRLYYSGSGSLHHSGSEIIGAEGCIAFKAIRDAKPRLYGRLLFPVLEDDPEDTSSPQDSIPQWSQLMKLVQPGQLALAIFDHTGKMLDCTGVAVWLRGWVEQLEADNTKTSDAAAYVRVIKGDPWADQAGSSMSSTSVAKITGHELGCVHVQEAPEKARTGGRSSRRSQWQYQFKVLEWSEQDSTLQDVTMPTVSALAGVWIAGKAGVAAKEGKTYEVRVDAATPAGLEVTWVKYSSPLGVKPWYLKGFIPTENIPMMMTEDEFQACVGRTVPAELLRIDYAHEILIFSGSQLPMSEDVDVIAGSLVNGTVRSSHPKGVTVLLSNGRKAWLPANRIFHPHVHTAAAAAKSFRRGEAVTLVVSSVDRTKGVISLSTHELEQQSTHLNAGDICQGKVILVKVYGAFIELHAGLVGLLHISQISHERVPAVEQVLGVGDRVRVMILKLDQANRRVTLSTKKLERNPGDFLRGRR